MKTLSRAIVPMLLAGLFAGCSHSDSSNAPPVPAPSPSPPGSGSGRPPVAPPAGSAAPAGSEGVTPPGQPTPPATPTPPPPIDTPGTGAGEVPPTGGPLGKGNPTSDGLDRHDALYCGEWQKTTKPGDTIYLVRGGKVTWSYSLNTSGGNEFGDCTLTSFGTVTYPLKKSGAFEMKVDEAKRKATSEDILWQYKQDGGSEVHSVQPIGKDQVLVMQNANPAPADADRQDPGQGLHVGQPQRLHPPAVEPDGRRRRPRSVPTRAPAGQRQPPHPPFAQGAMRLANGNTLVASWCGVDLKDTAQWANSWQYFELTHDMPPKVVWSLKQWANPNLGPGSSMQALDEPGVPENPGELAR